MLTLANAAVVLEHQPVAPPSLGYTRTMHHSSLLRPGDLWRPNPDEPPHIVNSMDHYDGRLTLTDQDGNIYHYPSDGLIATAVADSIKVITRLPSRWTKPPPRRRRRRGSEESGTPPDDNDGRGPPRRQ